MAQYLDASLLLASLDGEITAAAVEKMLDGETELLWEWGDNTAAAVKKV